MKPISHHTHWLRRARWGGAMVLAGLLVACGGGDDEAPPDPLQKYREQTVAWQACDATILGRTSDKIDELWASLGDRLRCADVRVPLDWASPERGDLFISVLRVAAGQGERRRGALLFNPGGPGNDGLDTGLNLVVAFGGSDPASPLGALQRRLFDEYDLVGFSPRGTGASSRLQCGTNELERFVDFSAAHWDTPENIANAHYNGRKTAEACLRNPITPFINTDATARDMDLLRGLLGDDKLNYLGYSYGTWLGAWYASLFPERVGRMVLDSSVDFTATLEQAVLDRQPPARQRLFDEVLAPYAARHAAHFALGATEAEVRAVIPSLTASMQPVLAIPLSGLGSKRRQADDYLTSIRAARELDALIQAAPDATDAEALHEALQQHLFDAASPERDAVVRERANGLLESYAGMWLHRQAESILLDASTSGQTAVHCNDTPAVTDLTAWTARVRALAARAPMFFGALLQQHACAFWGGQRVAKPDLAAMTPLDLLFVQSQYDSATATEGADAFFARLPQARRVLVPGGYDHGVYPYLDGCVDWTVSRYLLGESPTRRETTCAAHPLPLDAPAAEQKSQAAYDPPAPAASAAPPVYRNPQRARELIERLKEGIGRPGLGR